MPVENWLVGSFFSKLLRDLFGRPAFEADRRAPWSIVKAISFKTRIAS